MDRVITYSEALREATEQEMDRDAGVMVFGIGVPDHKAVYGTTAGLLAKFGPDRVFDTPLSEDAVTGFALGAAMAGMRPIHVHIRMDFLLLAMNQLVNIAAKARYMYGGAVSVPIVVRGIVGRSWGQGAQHSQSLYSMFMHVPGLRVVAPTTPHDAKGLLIQSIRDDNPVLFVEHRLLHRLKGPVPAEPYTLPFGKARVLRTGDDVTLVGVSYASIECLRAAEMLCEAGISAEVVDCVSLAPLDMETISASAAKTGRAYVVDCDWTTCGASAEILARLAECFQEERHIKVKRTGFAPVTCPMSKSLEKLFYPSSDRIASDVYQWLRPAGKPWTPDAREAPEILEFKGPF